MARDYAAEYARRQARAQQAGFGSYYDQRQRGGAKRATPDTPRVTGDEAAKQRGHRGAADFERLANTDRIAYVSAIPAERDAQGRIIAVTLLVELWDGTTREYKLRGKDLNPRTLNRIWDELSSGGATVVDRYNMFGWYEMDDYDADGYDLAA